MNINDYLIWRGDLPFKNYPFNEIDSLILSRLSYLPFDKITLKNSATLKEISKMMESIKSYKIPDDEYLIKNLGISERFSNLKVTDFKINKSMVTEKQFGAITIHLDDFIYISFIGTDNSIVGWKEDFNMCYMEHVPAQEEGVKYLNDIAHKYEKKIMIGGHSKGGNVAVYSALYCDEDVKKRIISVNNFDGPGFDKSVIDAHNNKDIIKYITTYIPQDSVIGRLLYHKEKSIVVKSNNSGLYQHDIYSWQIIKNRFIKLDSVTESSEFTNQIINEWLINTDKKNRKIFVDGIFELFYSTKSESFKELSKTWVKDIPNMLNAYSEISKEDKKIIGKMILKFASAYSSSFKNLGKKKLEVFENKINEDFLKKSVDL